MAPFHEIKVRTGKSCTVKLNVEANRAKRHRRRCEKRYHRSNSKVDRVIYRKACRDANRLIIGAQRDAIQKKLTLAGNDQREVWRISNDLLHRCGKQQNTDNAESLCLSFRQFFIGKLQMIQAKIRLELISYGFTLLDLMAKPAQVIDSFTDTTPAEVAKVINGIKCKNSPTDIIPTIVIKRCVDVFALALLYAINMSFSSGNFPRIFKIGHVVPLLKKPGSDVSDPSNYRPIRNLSTISKVFEKLALTCLRPHLHGSSNFSSHQSAYRSGHSTETATLRVMDDLNSNMDNKSCSLLLSLDISAAFDMLDIDTLLSRLHFDFCITGIASAWLRSYLTDRLCYVAVGNSRSDTWICHEGVPQGSVLGPLLFSSYVSPIARIFDRFDISYHQYADDTQLYTAVRSSEDTSRLLMCVEEVTRWFLINGLLLNASKTEAIAFGTRQQLVKRSTDTSLKIGDASLAIVGNIKLLGVIFDSTLSMDQQVNAVVKACNFHIHALRHVRSCLTPEAA